MTISSHSISGYFSASIVSAIHYQDIFMALLLGFGGALGGYIFKLFKEAVLDRTK